jgi:hypothetical protein
MRVIASVFIVGVYGLMSVPSLASGEAAGVQPSSQPASLVSSTNAVQAVVPQPSAVKPLPGTLPELEAMLQNVTNDLAMVKREEAEQMQTIRSHQKDYSEMASAISTQDVEVVRMRKRMDDLAAESKALGVELQKRLESLPAYQELTARSKADMDKTVHLREKERELLRERMRVSGEIWRLQKLQQGPTEEKVKGEGSPRGATGTVAAP